MDVYGCAWVCMDVGSRIWIIMCDVYVYNYDACGFARMCMGVDVCGWMCVDVYGYVGMCMGVDLCGCVLIIMCG